MITQRRNRWRVVLEDGTVKKFGSKVQAELFLAGLGRPQETENGSTSSEEVVEEGSEVEESWSYSVQQTEENPEAPEEVARSSSEGGDED